VRKEDLQQEAWIAFAQSVERYDGRSRGAYWTYLRLSLHTRFRQFAAHDRVIPIPHDTRQQRAHWHKITQETFDARLQAQNLSYPDAETEGWNTIMKGGDHNMENVVIEKMDLNAMRHKLQRLPRRWRDLLLLSQKYENQDLAPMLAIDVDEMVSLYTQIMTFLRTMPIESFVYGKSESEYLADWDKLRE
jgi:DNA-directed RNA polymerase specialized sigma24 family protein